LHILFVDLIKAFDTVNDDLLVRHLHKDFHMEFKIDKDNQCHIPALVHFLFLLQTFAESTKEAWARDIKPISTLICPKPDEILHHGELIKPKQPRMTKGRIVVIGFTIFINDTVFVFTSQAAMELALPFLQ